MTGRSPPRWEVNVGAVLIAGEKGTSVVHTEITMFDRAAAYRWLGIFCLQSAHCGESLDSNIDWLLESGLGYIWKCFCLCLHFFCFVACQLFVCGVGLSYTASWSSPLWQTVSSACVTLLSGKIHVREYITLLKSHVTAVDFKHLRNLLWRKNAPPSVRFIVIAQPCGKFIILII